MKTKWLLLFAVVLVFAGCRKNTEELNIENEVPAPPITVKLVNSSLVGTVIDEAGNPVEGASVQLDDLTTTTDANGVFSFRNTTMNSTGTYIQVHAAGYFPGSKTIFTSENNTAYTRIQLLDRTIVGSFDSQNGGTVSLAEGGQIAFAANGVIDQSGAPYSGTVEVAANWLNPADPDFQLQMPGDLRAIDANAENVVLASFGMMAVELQSPDGSPLQISQAATLTIPVPNSMVNGAPTTIPLWYFDEAEGVWKEEGLASLIGDQYVGTVEHFTFWNCDFPMPVVHLSGQVLFDDKPVAGYLVRLQILSMPGTSGAAYTSNDGTFGGLVPAGEIMLLEVLNACSEVIYSTEIGPFSEDTVLDPILVDIGLVNAFSTITGTIVNCNGAQVEDGYALLDGGEFNIFGVTEDGAFSIVFPVCTATEVEITGIDLSTGLTSGVQSYNIEPAIEAGELQACDNQLDPPYIALVLNGDNYLMVDADTNNFIEPVVLLDEVNSGFGTPSIKFSGANVYNNGAVEQFLYLDFEIPTQNILADIPQGILTLYYWDSGGTLISWGAQAITDFNDLDVTEFSNGIVGGAFDVVLPTSPETEMSGHFRVPLE